jgi:hypothetical protein
MTNLSNIVGDNDVLTETSTNTVTNKSIDASQLTGSVAMARLGSGTADSTTFLRGDGTFASAGLNHFSDDQNTSAPNDTVPVNSFEASGTQGNIDLALLPKGTGALTRHIADGATAGGNKRGIYAVDWQGLRVNEFDVASGDYGTVSGGRANSASQNYSTVSGGYNSSATDDYATVVGGWLNTASNNHSVAGGYSSQASGWNSLAIADTGIASGQGAVVLGGDSSRADGYYSVGIGYSADAKQRPSILCIGGQNRSASYQTLDHQTAIQCLGGLTADATAYQLAGYKNTSTLYMNNLDAGNAYVFTAYVIGTDSTDTAAWEFKGVVRRVGSASPTFVGTPSKSSVAATSGASTWDADIVISAGNSFTIEVTGEAARTIIWTGSIWTTETV